MATAPINRRDTSTPEERSASLREQLAAREAGRTVKSAASSTASSDPVKALDTFESAVPLDRIAADVGRVGFGETDTTEMTGDASLDQDLADQAGLDNEELAEGQSAIDEHQAARDAKLASLLPDEDDGTRQPPIRGTTDRLAGLSGSNGAAISQDGASGGGQGGADETSAGRRSVPDELATGADAISTASGQQRDMGYLAGDPRDLVKQGGGNSPAAASDAVHDALGAVVEERMHARVGRESVAQDGGALASAIAGANKEHPDGAAPSTAPAAPAAAPPATAPATVGGKIGEGVAINANAKQMLGELDDGVGAIPKDTIAVAAAKGGLNDDPDPTTPFNFFAKKVVESDYQKEWGDTERRAAELHKKRGGGAGDPGNPDDDERRAPPTEAERALRAATNRLLGRNDALVHGPATRINPGDQGEVFQGGTGEAPDPWETKQSMVGRPREDAHRPPPSNEPGQPSHGPDGTEVLVEDGNPFTGGQRNEGPEDVQFGRVEPLIGLNRDSEDTAVASTDDADNRSHGKASSFSIFDDDSD